MQKDCFIKENPKYFLNYYSLAYIPFVSCPVFTLVRRALAGGRGSRWHRHLDSVYIDRRPPVPSSSQENGGGHFGLLVMFYILELRVKRAKSGSGVLFQVAKEITEPNLVELLMKRGCCAGVRVL